MENKYLIYWGRYVLFYLCRKKTNHKIAKESLKIGKNKENHGKTMRFRIEPAILIIYIRRTGENKNKNK